VKEEGLW